MDWKDKFLDRVVCGDCLELMKELPDGCVDLVVTSPPYNCRKDYGQKEDEMPWAEYYEWMEEIVSECYRLLCLGGTLAINVPGVVRWQSDHRYSQTWGDFDATYRTHRRGEQVIGKGRLEPVGFVLFGVMGKYDIHLREPIIWVKGSPGTAICSDYRMGCDSDPYMRPAHEFILLGSKERWFHRGGTGRRGSGAVPFLEETKDVWFISPAHRNDHPAIFPVELSVRLIRLFIHAEDGIVFDPLLGSGTTAVAAKQLGRHFIGMEIEPKYCEIAERRLSQEVLKL